MLHSSNIATLFKKYSYLDGRILNLLYCIVKRNYMKHNLKEYSKCYQLLEIPDGSDQECVRKAFIELCKKYHPDSGKPTADPLKFQQIESAYRTLQSKFADERWNVNEGIGEYGLYYKEKNVNKSDQKPEVFDIKHTAPQHRQYLSYEGVGSGTPSQRQKQYVKYRTMVAVENVYDHQIKKLSESSNLEPSLVVKDKTEAKKIKTRYGMERLVEDLIQESIAKGQFENLKGQGKPLPESNFNPYVDFVTHKMNEILIDNGFTPEWITLQKEISDETNFIKERLAREREKLGPLPLNYIEENKWYTAVENLQKDVVKLNQKINKYNLVVPMLQKQKLYFDLKKESCYILNHGKYHYEHLSKEEKVEKTFVVDKENNNLLSNLFSLFK